MAQLQWDVLPVEERRKIMLRDVETVTWNRLPFVRGWQYRAVLRVGSERSSRFLGSTFEVLETSLNDGELVLSRIASLRLSISQTRCLFSIVSYGARRRWDG